MPRVNIYRGSSVRPEGTTGARLVAADFRRSALGEGLQAAGRAMGEYAEREDQIESIYDEQDVQRLDLEHMKQTQVLSDRLREARGAGARAEADRLTRELGEYNGTLAARARSPRARTALENSITRRTIGEVERYQAYADGEFVQDFRATNDASMNAAVERVRDIADPVEARDELDMEVGELIRSRAEFEGWEGGTSGPRAQAARLEVTDRFHMDRTRALAREDPMAARDYAIAHREEMKADTLEGILDSVNEEALEQEMTQWVDSSEPVAANDDETEAPAEPRDEVPIRYEWSVNSGVGRRAAPTAGASTNHAGTDYDAPHGAQVPVTLSGRVTFAGQRGGYGNLVIVDHGNGIETRYAHLSAINVQQGQRIDRGSNVGRVGNTGRTTGTHLHYEIRRDGRPVAPGVITSARVHPTGTRPNVEAGGDMEAQVEAIRGNDSFSWRQKQVAERIVRRRFGEAMQARQHAENEADRAAAAAVAELGDSFTSTSQLPADVLGRLGPSDRLRYSNMAQGNRDRQENQPPSPDLMFYISHTRASNPTHYMSEAFLQEVASRGGSPAMLRQIATEQGQLAGTRIPAERSAIWTIAEPIFTAAGIHLDTLTPGQDSSQSNAERQRDAEQKNAILGNLERLHNAYTQANPGRTPTSEIIREWVSRSIAAPASGGERYSLFAFDDDQLVVRLNPRDRARAVQELQAARLPVNNQTIAEAVRRRLAGTRRAP